VHAVGEPLVDELHVGVAIFRVALGGEGAGVGEFFCDSGDEGFGGIRGV
jgi:uncharacterized spore protein YtfJ